MEGNKTISVNREDISYWMKIKHDLEMILGKDLEIKSSVDFEGNYTATNRKEKAKKSEIGTG